jgi:IclR family acetate operon transcriptional repressor
VHSMRQAAAEPPLAERPSVNRLLELIEILASARRSLTVAEIGEALGVSRPQAHRIVAALERSDVLARHPRNRRVIFGARLGRAMLRIGSMSSLQPIWHPILRGVVEQVGETCNLIMFPRATPTYFDRVEANWPLSVRLQAGSKVPLHCTAGGKLYLANLPASERELLLEHLPIPPLTANTITERDALRRDLQTTAADGFATDQEEFIQGMIAVAVPIRSGDGTFLGALGMHAPGARHGPDGLRAFLPALCAGARGLAAILEHDAQPGGIEQ